MKNGKVLTLFGNIFATLVLVSLLFLSAACAAPTPTTTPSASPAKTSVAPVPAATTAAPATTVAKPQPTTAPADGQVWNIRYTAVGAGASAFGSAKVAWAKKIEAATNGRVKITTYQDAILSPNEATWSAVTTGVAQIGEAMTGFFPNQFPLTEVGTLPFASSTGENNCRVMMQLYNEFPEIQAEYKEVKLLDLISTESNVLVTTRKPVRTMEDMKGLKIKAVGGATEMVKALGGVPVSIAMPDSYLGLQKGVIDGMLCTWEAIQGYRFYEVTKYVTDVPTGGTVFWTVMNLKLWNELPPDIQKQILSVSGETQTAIYGKMFDQMKETTLSEMKQKNTGWPTELITLSPQELQRWIDVGGKPIWSDWWVKKYATKGPTQKILDRCLALHAELQKK
jgi:TRAP-type C4-dicarboxylate transport system substrate-binding protein